MDNERRKFMAIFQDCKKRGEKHSGGCYYPGCKEKPIQSHILQRNGILDEIGVGNHAYENGINVFEDNFLTPVRRGLKQIFTFPGFCNPHDKKLFNPIEVEGFNLSSYTNRLLFTIRTLYQERYKKEVGIYQYGCILEKDHKLIPVDLINGQIRQLKLGLEDIKDLEGKIWKDYETGTDSFEFYLRILPKKEVIISSFFDYETSAEMQFLQAINTHLKRVAMSPIFICTFPKGNNSILLLGHQKSNHRKVGEYISKYFIKSSETNVFTVLSNLMFFQCENWICSERFYKAKLKDKEKMLTKTALFSNQNTNERIICNLNIFSDDFETQLSAWNHSYNQGEIQLKEIW